MKVSKPTRKQLWDSHEGCDCPSLGTPLGERDRVTPHDRCTTSTVRCHGRLGRIHHDFATYGYVFGQKT
jgi:hypothetical protein